MILRRVGIASLCRMLGALYAFMGLILGAFCTVISLVTGAVGLISGNESVAGVVGLLFGVGAVIILPIFYGVIGLVTGAVGGLIYNLVAGLAGGIELELVEK